MTNIQYPITPPQELVQQWIEETRSHDTIGSYPEDLDQRIATRAAQWGADRELEACCEWLKSEGHEHEHEALFAAIRPKPPSLKEQALKTLNQIPDIQILEYDTIRRALEALPE